MVGMLEKFKNLFAARPTDVMSKRQLGITMETLWKSQTFNSVSHMLLEMPDPDAILRKAGIRRGTLEKLTYDDEISQAISTRLDGLTIVPVRLEPTESKESVFIQERCLTPIFLKKIITGAFKARLFGYSVMEIIWDEETYYKEKIYVPKDISERNIDLFVVRPDGTLIQMISRYGLTDITVDPELQKKIEDVPGSDMSAIVMDTKYKFLLTRNEATWENPYGEALLSRLWWPWFFRQKTWNFFGQYLERFAIPMLIGYSDDPERIAEALQVARQTTVMGVTSEAKVEILNGSTVGNGRDLYSEAEEMIIRRIEKLILGQTLTSGTDGGSGNRALGQVHNVVREDKTRSDIELVKTTVQNFVNTCFELHGFKGKAPEVIFGDDRALALERAQRDAILIQNNIVGGYSDDYLMDNYGFRPGEFIRAEKPSFINPSEVIEVEENNNDTRSEGKEEPETEDEEKEEAGGNEAEFSAKGHPHDLEIEALALWAARRAGSPTDPNEIKAAILESDSAMEMMERLAKLETRPDFAARLLDVNEAAFSLGVKENKKNV